MDQLSSGASIQNYHLVSNWIHFKDDRVIILTGKVDIGQHISTTLAFISSKELDINMNKIDVLNLKTDISPDEGFTAGSLSVTHSGTALKTASITFRNSFIEYVCLKYMLFSLLAKDNESPNIVTIFIIDSINFRIFIN